MLLVERKLFMIYTSMKESDFKNKSSYVFWKDELKNIYYNVFEKMTKKEALYVVNNLLEYESEILNDILLKDIEDVLKNYLVYINDREE